MNEYSGLDYMIPGSNFLPNWDRRVSAQLYDPDTRTVAKSFSAYSTQGLADWLDEHGHPRYLLVIVTHHWISVGYDGTLVDDKLQEAVEKCGGSDMINRHIYDEHDRYMMWCFVMV